MLPDTTYPVLFFDGVCNLCNNYVQFIIKRDKKQQFKFSSLQSGTGSSLQQYIQNDIGVVPDSVILVHHNRYYTKADAVLKTASLFGGIYNLLLVGYILPRFIRNAIYDFVAKRRYNWFGKRDECMMPTPDLKSRFLD